MPPLKGRLELTEITPHAVGMLKLVHQSIFPVVYNEKFYKQVLESGDFARLAYFDDIVAGAVCCREEVNKETGNARLYIMTLGCLAAYRRLGLGSMMVEYVLELAKRLDKFESVFLHVQTSNDAAIEFYKKHGFQITETISDYYKRIEPTDAHVLEYKL